MALSSSAASSTISSSSPSLIISLLETVGIQVSVCYLQPSDLFSLSLTSRQLHDTIFRTSTLIQTVQHQLPIQLGVSTNYLAELRESHLSNSHRSKNELVTHVLDQLHSSQILLLDTNSAQQSEEKAKQLFLNQGKSSVMCYAANDTQRRATTVECHFQTNATNESATAWIDYILDRDACKRYGQDRVRNKFVRDWLMFILSSLQRTIANNHNNNNSSSSNIQIWRWGCKHSNLSGKGVSGVGVMIVSSISSSCSVDDLELELELRLTRLY